MAQLHALQTGGGNARAAAADLTLSSSCGQSSKTRGNETGSVFREFRSQRFHADLSWFAVSCLAGGHFLCSLGGFVAVHHLRACDGLRIYTEPNAFEPASPRVASGASRSGPGHGRHVAETTPARSLFGRVAIDRRQPKRNHADLRQDPHRQDRHARGGAVRLHREREGEDPGQGGHPSRPAAPHLRGQAARGRPHALRLQHPEGVDAPPGAPPPRRREADRRQVGVRRAHRRRQGRRHPTSPPCGAARAK